MNKSTIMKYVLLGIALIAVVYIGFQSGGIRPDKTVELENGLFDTGGVKHTINLNEILAGGPPQDGIPSIDEPAFVSIEQAQKEIQTDQSGIFYTQGAESRFYPYNILVWHEIVNDTFGETPVLVTYCPLCETGIVFDPIVDGVVYEFGTSGQLWRSNLLMYNRTENPEDETLWSQILGTGVVGDLAGKNLTILASDTVTFDQWRRQNPNGVVLSSDTGVDRDYTANPYGEYADSDQLIFGEFDDSRAHPKAYVLGIVLPDGSAKAYVAEDLQASTTDAVGDFTIEITKRLDGTFEFTVDGERITHTSGFWFSWLLIHPQSELYESS